jgi:hypothetical protein
MSSNPYESPASLPPPPQPVVATANVPTQSLESQVRLLFQQGANGANWFYWIAGLSLINSVITLVGGQINFVLGLAATGIADQIAMLVAQKTPEAAMVAKLIAFAWAVVVALMVAGIGKLAGRRYMAVYAIGMGLYLVDGLLFLVLASWLSAAFHVYALFMLARGFKAFRQLQAIENNLAQNTSFAIDVGTHLPPR